MDQDLQDLLALWLGDHDPGEARRTALLARLRTDDAFRQIFIGEVRLLGMLRAVQSAEPRWLLLEDTIGWSAQQRQDIEALVQQVVANGRRRRLRRWLVRSSAALAAAIVIAVGLFFAGRPGQAPGPVEPPAEAPAAGVDLATAIKLEDVCWAPGGPAPGEGGIVTSGRLRLQSGRLTLAFFSGVSLSIEGPADLELVAANRVFCHYGKLRARVPRGAEGFTVLVAGYEIMDLGTEFALNLEPGGTSRLMVFDGAAALSVLGKDGRSVRGALLEEWRSVEVDTTATRIQELLPKPETFIPLPPFVPAPLDLAPNYADEVLAAKPWGYWRFEELVNGRVPNEVPGRPALRALGGVGLEIAPGGSRCAYFSHDDPGQAFLMDGDWTPPRAGGYAIELWVRADLPTPRAQGRTALVGLIDRAEGPTERHLAYLELTARGRRSPHEPCTVRFLDRWPTAQWGGADAFSRRTVVASLWHHLVGQKAGDMLELYVDGERVGTTPAKLNAKDPQDAVTTACHLLVGRLKRRSLPPDESEIRAFEGCLDELAVYDRPLTPEEIRHHARLRTPGGP